jgi:peptidoglycan/xylan/chitin deacetylase (PgdA/CDA1 family)
MQTASMFGADALALRRQNRNGRQRGLVIGAHETPPAMEAQFRTQLEWVAQHFTITRLEDFARIWEKPFGYEAGRKPPILFTFDDGRESNYGVAARLLESFGGRGVFFVVPAFAECAADEALNFYRSRINPDSRPGDETWEDWRPMSRGQIAELAARGHAIGNHTFTHERLVGLSHEKLEREIGDSARKLGEWTGSPIAAFAWTFGWDAIDANAWDVIQRHHRFCFAPCAGVVDGFEDSPRLIWRREVEVKYSAAEYRFHYSGLGDPWWRARRKRLREMLRVPPRDGIR